MKHVNQLVTKNYQQQSAHGQQSKSAGQQEQPFCPANIELIEDLWATFANTFGGFVSQYGEAPNDDWIAALSNFTPDMIQQGVTKTMNSGREFAPPLPVFIAFCQTARREPAHKAFQLPPPCNINREVGKKRSARLVEIINDDAYWAIQRSIKALVANRKKLYSGMMKGLGA